MRRAETTKNVDNCQIVGETISHDVGIASGPPKRRPRAISNGRPMRTIAKTVTSITTPTTTATERLAWIDMTGCRLRSEASRGLSGRPPPAPRAPRNERAGQNPRDHCQAVHHHRPNRRCTQHEAHREASEQTPYQRAKTDKPLRLAGHGRPSRLVRPLIVTPHHSAS